MRGRIGRRIFIIAIVCLGLVVVYVRMSWRRFDARVWQDAVISARSPYPRRQMADDLLRRGLLKGLTADSLVRLLGPKPKTDYFASWDFVYWLGPERGFISIDSEWLVVDLGTDGKVARAEIVTD